MRTLIIILFVFLVPCFTSLVFGEQNENEGVWTASVDQHDRIHLGVFRERHHWNQMGVTFPRSAFSGLSTDTLTTQAIARADFQLVREAGTISFSGQFNKRRGAGHYLFVPRQEFLAEMARLGYRDIPPTKLFTIALHDIGPRYVRELAELEYKDLSLELLIKMGMFRVTPEFIRELRSLGFGEMSIDEIAQFGVHGVSKAYVDELRTAGFRNLSPSQVKKMKIHGVSRSYIEQMRAAGYENLTPEQLIKLRIHGVDKNYVEELKRIP